MKHQALLVVAVLAVVFGSAHSHAHLPRYSEIKAAKLEAFIEFRDLLSSLMGVGDSSVEKLGGPGGPKGKVARLATFSFSNCGDPSQEIAVLSDVTVQPDPIKLPGNITVGASLNISAPFGSPVRTSLTIEKKTFLGWITIPCISGVGSCTYDDVCSMIKPPTCPPIFQKINLPCKCPFPEGTWTLPATPFALDVSIPVSGDIRVKADASYKGKPLTCVEIVVTLA